MFTAYGAAHRRLRTLVSPAFTKKRTDGLIPRVREITGSLLDALDQTPHGQPVDLRERFTHPLPMAVICELFGVPADRRAETGSLIAGITNTAATPEEAAATFVAVHELLADLVAAKRAAPGDDLTSALIAAREGGTALTESELVDTLLLVIGAGFETTVHLIGNAVHALLTHPDQHELVRTGARTWDDVIEETLRWAPSIAGLPLRYAVEDIRVDDAVTIAEGEAILINYLAANHDPRRFGADAGAFDLTREDKDHLAFGWGVHRCIGAPLARAEAGIALPELFARFPGLRLAAGPDGIAHVNSFITHGHETLPVRLTG